jgi:cyclopropane-fatty-acyl-phospholipid synthase
MLRLTAERAGLADGQRILDLGCGWGSLSLWAAERFPRARVTAVSNSAPQREHLLSRARRLGLGNLEVLTADMNDFAPRGAFDRVVSVEMFEHMRNWQELLRRIRGWLAPGGRLFVHVFASRRFAYPFLASGEDDWMGRQFFTGGIMPCEDLIERVGGPFQVERRWTVSGTHYARTAEAWHQNLLRRRFEATAALSRALGPAQARLAVRRWRMFFLACAELFAWDRGREWVVSHSLLRPEEGP